ncbi:uncharacterized protein C8Q71DRAFT_699598 [Rhodofomes roseus]|uniref:Uncharacterized protein n=1 Tax=Rhodofomes roseus TaxID=34475 RepID=A0ABQ8KW49_9APHY|nr:uncharacterized protein C8Q71DRAFT_699598 [Rhodofomes roseus]KAH9843072.1 hypothetical protein C8Q71DRAFT_699598 [Rhodofomes roseus]
MAHEKPRSSHKSREVGRTVYAYPPIPIYLDEDYEDSGTLSDRSAKPTSTRSKTRQTSSKVAPDVHADAVAGTGFTTLTVHGTIPVHTGILPVVAPATPVANGIERTPGFSPLPIATPAAATGFTSTLAAKRFCPTPSLPILQDPFADQVAAGDEESLFGGKERLSGQPPSNAAWTWTHYSHPSLTKTPLTSGARHGFDMVAASEKTMTQAQATVKPSMDGGFLEMSKNGTSYLKPSHGPPTQITRAVKRVSIASPSIYPGTPQSAYGIAVGSASPLTADGMPLLQRSVSKASTRRRSRSRRSLQLASLDKEEESAEHGDADPYDGLRLSTAVIPQPAPALKKSSSVQGRARVKAPYAPGSVLRASSTMGALATQANPFDDSQYVLPPLSPALKTEATRERDTKALATALGLASPAPLSRPTTVHLEDSVTLVGERRKSRPLSQVRSRPQSQMLSPNMEASARLGNLMLANFSSMTSLPSTSTAETGSGRNRPMRKRTDDKPPRVPSPPPMPSLAQMALAHTNPEEFADYKSPTYSIYGLYEADRKSHFPGEGGY